jgi:hypothetical protein
VKADGQIDGYFSLERVKHIVDALEASPDPWAAKTAATLRKRSPLMLHVTLEQIRRARGMSLADNLRMERDLVTSAFTCGRARPARPSKAYAPWRLTRTTSRSGTRCALKT